jgi:hypothetical protein
MRMLFEIFDERRNVMSVKNAKLKSKGLLSRLGGFSAFGFGVSNQQRQTAQSCENF